MKRKSIYLAIAAMLISTSMLYSCTINTATKTSTTTQSTTATQVKASILGDKSVKSVIDATVTYDSNDYYTDWKNENPNYVELSGTSISLKGSGAQIDGSKITINSAGVYVISGKLDDGQIIIDVKDKGVVKLVLNGAEIKSSKNSPIYVKNSGKTILSLQEGTVNTVTDGAKYVLEDSSSDEPNSAIFSKDNLTINGTGKLIVNGNYNNGITSKDDLKITGGDIKVTSKDDGLIGKDIVAVKAGTITVDAGGDAVRATNDSDSTKGIVAIEDGTFNLKAKTDGIQGETAVLIEGGNFNITSGGGSVNGTKKAEDNMGGGFGGKNNNSSKNSNSSSTSTTETKADSTKGIKAGADIGISGGTFNIDSASDAVHSNNNVIITGGNITIMSGDDGIHANSTLTAKGGKINITKSYEGIESNIITIVDGEINITSSDDGVSASSGASGNTNPGQNNPSSSNSKLNINGGYLAVNAIGDGLDANGSISMTKGTVVVSGPTANMNGALDYDGTFEMTGGFIVAAGSSGMAQGPSDSSTQNSIVMTYSSMQKAGTIVNLQDSNGKSIAIVAPAKDYQTVVISSPELKKDGKYILYSGGTSTGTVRDGLYTGGNYQNGAKVVEFSVSSSATWLNESGVTAAKSSMQGGGQGGPGGPGGHRGGNK